MKAGAGGVRLALVRLADEADDEADDDLLRPDEPGAALELLFLALLWVESLWTADAECCWNVRGEDAGLAARERAVRTETRITAEGREI